MQYFDLHMHSRYSNDGGFTVKDIVNVVYRMELIFFQLQTTIQ